MPCLEGRELEYVTDAVRSGWVSSLGNYVSRFEKEFADFCGTKHAITVTNGTATAAVKFNMLDFEQAQSIT